MSDPVKFKGKVIGHLEQNVIGLWIATDQKGNVLATFPNRTRAIDALVSISVSSNKQQR